MKNATQIQLLSVLEINYVVKSVFSWLRLYAWRPPPCLGAEDFSAAGDLSVCMTLVEIQRNHRFGIAVSSIRLLYLIRKSA